MRLQPRFVVLGMLAALATLLLTASVSRAHVEFFQVNEDVDLSPDLTVVTVTGLVRCTAGEPDASLSALVFQSVKGKVAAGGGNTTAPCDGTNQPWAATGAIILLSGSADSFKAGQAIGLASVSTSGLDGFDSDTVLVPLKLNK